MRIEFTYARSSDYFRSPLSPAAKRLAKPFVLGAALLVVLGIMVVICSEVSPMGVLAGAGCVFLGFVLLWLAQRRYLAEVVVPESWHTERHWLITDEALESWTETTQSRWTWAAVTRITVRPEAYHFWREGPRLFDLPREPLTAAHEAQLRAFLHGRGLLPEESSARR